MESVSSFNGDRGQTQSEGLISERPTTDAPRQAA
jgi:hypothetical protein